MVTDNIAVAFGTFSTDRGEARAKPDTETGILRLYAGNKKKEKNQGDWKSCHHRRLGLAVRLN
jgi:hypothetical protein